MTALGGLRGASSPPGDIKMNSKLKKSIDFTPFEALGLFISAFGSYAPTAGSTFCPFFRVSGHLFLPMAYTKLAKSAVKPRFSDVATQLDNGPMPGGALSQPKL